MAHIRTRFHVQNMQVLARVDEGERVWAKIDMRELRLKERKIIIRTQRDEIASLKLDKKELKNEVDLLKKCYAALHLELSETGDRIDMSWLLSQLRNNATLKEKNAELEEMLVGKGYTVKAAEAENDLRKKELELTTEIEEIKAIKEVMESLRDNANDGDGIEISELLNKLEVAILMLGSEGVPNERVGAIVHNNAILKDRVSELEEIIRGQGYTVKAAAAERDLRTKEVNLAEKVQTITEVLETLNDVIDGVDNTEAAVLLRRLEEVLLSFSYESEPSMEILTQHSIISEVGWNLGCVTYEPNDYAALAIGQSDSTVTTIRTPSSARSDGVWTQLHQSEAVTKD